MQFVFPNLIAVVQPDTPFVEDAGDDQRVGCSVQTPVPTHEGFLVVVGQQGLEPAGLRDTGHNPRRDQVVGLETAEGG